MRKGDEVSELKVVVCPACGADLAKLPKQVFAVCQNCQNSRVYPRFTEAERTAAKRAMLPEATRLECNRTWWRLSDRHGIWSAKAVPDYPGAVRARCGGVTGWFICDAAAEVELREVLG